MHGVVCISTHCGHVKRTGHLHIALVYHCEGAILQTTSKLLSASSKIACLTGSWSGQDPFRSNWLRFIRVSRGESHNMTAFQTGGDIYYRTVQTIRPNTELLVCYDGAATASTSSSNVDVDGNVCMMERGDDVSGAQSHDVSVVSTSGAGDVVSGNAGKCKHQCDVCKKMFSRPSKLITHKPP